MAANPVLPTFELQFTTDEKFEETIVYGAGKITSATSNNFIEKNCPAW